MKLLAGRSALPVPELAERHENCGERADGSVSDCRPGFQDRSSESLARAEHFPLRLFPVPGPEVVIVA